MAEPGASGKRVNDRLPRVAGKLKAGEPVGALVLGDSIARGDDASTPAHGFISLWADQLHGEFGSRIQVTNMSQGGNTARDLRRLLRITRTLHLYDLVVVAIGVNDATLNGRGRPQVSVRSFARSIRKVIRRARDAGCDVLLVSPIVPARKLPTADIEDYREQLERTAVAERCAFADVTRAWREQAGEHLLANELNHPGDHGHRLCAETMITTTLE
jgi:lysophospholipase L1-like esterase